MRDRRDPDVDRQLTQPCRLEQSSHHKGIERRRSIRTLLAQHREQTLDAEGLIELQDLLRQRDAGSVCRMLLAVERLCNTVDAVIGIRAGILDGSGYDTFNPFQRDPDIPGDGLSQRLDNLCGAANRVTREIDAALEANGGGWRDRDAA